MEFPRRIRRGQRALGALVRMPSEMLVELAGMVGLDYIVIDCEHGPADQVSLGHHIAAAEAMGLPVIVRIGALGDILRVLDLGAAGVICPHVDSVDEARALADAVLYPPRGRRGFAGYTRAGSYGLVSGAAHLERYADGPLVVAMIESEQGLAAAGAILAVDGIDLLFLGPADLAADLGVLGGDPGPVAAALDQLRATTGGRVLSICGDAQTARAHFRDGSRMVVYNIQHALSATFAALADARPESGPTRVNPAAAGALVLLPGMLGDESVWSEVAPGLSDLVTPVFARIDRDDSIEDMAQAVLAMAPPRFAIAGHSLGGIVALEVQRRAPDRVTGLALLNTSARGPSTAQQEQWAAMRQRTEAGDFRPVADELARHTLPDGRRDEGDLLARNRRMADTVGDDGFLRQLQAQATRPDSVPLLGGVDTPTLVVSGSLDEVCHPDLQAELAAGIPAARRVVIDRCGHMAPLERPREVIAALRTWLTDSR